MVSYENGGYRVTLHPDGTKVREQTGDGPPLQPEHMDLKITDWCDGGCAWCHEESTPAGRHADLAATLRLLEPLKPGTEVAIGGGDPLSHPKFGWFVETLSARGLFPSVTVNGKHFDRHRAELDRLTSKGCLYGVGFSYQGEMPDWDWPHLVVHLITGIHKPEVLDDEPSRKVLLLGYKRHGRGAGLFDIIPGSVTANVAQWYRELFHVAETHQLSFDNLAIGELAPHRLFKSRLDYETRFMGEEGSFGMYVDAVTQTYGLSSYSDDRKNWTDILAMFKDVRELTSAMVETGG